MLKNPAITSQSMRPLAPEPESFVHALLAAQDIATLALVAVRQLQNLGLRQVQLVWNHAPSPSAPLHTSNDTPPDAATMALLEAARRQGGHAQRSDETGFVQCVQVVAQNTGLWVALSVGYEPARADPEWQAKIAPLSVRCQSLLYTQRLQVDVERLASAERLQRALFAISDIASSDHSTAEVLSGLHEIVGSLMYAENFYIVRFDPGRQTIRFLYFADSHDPSVPGPRRHAELGGDVATALTLALLRHGKPIRGPSEQLRKMLDVPRDDTLGPDTEDWMGVPIVEDGTVLGAVVVQSYDPAVRYSESDQRAARLRRPAHPHAHCRGATRRKNWNGASRSAPGAAQADPRAPAQRAAAGAPCTGSPNCRCRATASRSSTPRCTSIVGELLDARNFYIALLTEDGAGLEFPYSVDERDQRQRSRALGRGLTEYVLRTGEATARRPRRHRGARIPWRSAFARHQVGVLAGRAAA